MGPKTSELLERVQMDGQVERNNKKLTQLSEVSVTTCQDYLS